MAYETDERFNQEQKKYLQQTRDEIIITGYSDKTLKMYFVI